MMMMTIIIIIMIIIIQKAARAGLKMLIHAHFSVLMGILTSKAGHINLVFGL